MKTRHTPGPWTVEDSSVTALVDSENSQTYIAPICEVDQEWAMADANAHLIAAAPDLLAALEDVAAELDARGKVFDGDETADRVRAVIAKVTGGGA